MTSALSASSTCPCLVERAMMPPSIVSEAYYADVAPPPSPDPLEPVIHRRYPSLLTFKDELRDEIARIFSDTTRPSLPPFTLASGSLWDSPTQSTSVGFGRPMSGGRASGYSQRSPHRQSSFDSLMSTPSVASTPAYFGAHRRSSVDSNNSSSSASSAGLGFSGICRQDGTPFDGYGLLQPVMYADGTQAPPHVYPYTGFGLGFYGHDQEYWRWAGEQELLFGADVDKTLVDSRHMKGDRHMSYSADSSRSGQQMFFSPPGLSKRGLTPDLERLFGDLSVGSSSSKPLVTLPTYKPTPRSSSTIQDRSSSSSGRAYKSPGSSRKDRRGYANNLSRTVPLPPSGSDVFFISTPLTAVNTPSAFSSNQAEALNVLELRKRDRDASTWSLPPISMKPKRARL